MSIEELMFAGAGIGLLVSLLPSAKAGLAVLCIIPVAMLAYVDVELANPLRQPDAFDALLYLFGPLWPSVGAIGGFFAGRLARKWILSRKRRSS